MKFVGNYTTNLNPNIFKGKKPLLYRKWESPFLQKSYFINTSNLMKPIDTRVLIEMRATKQQI